MPRQLQQQGFGKKSTVNSAQASHHLSAREEEASSSSVPPLADADYEFLFTQLLEGVAHGWHPPRIAKFFQQLGDRGQPQQWVAWLERFSTKILASSHAHEQELGARMMRLGQLTESTPSVQPIGMAAYQIGRQLLYGNTLNLVWEYEGPDLAIAESCSDCTLSEEPAATNFPSTATVSREILTDPKAPEKELSQNESAATDRLLASDSSAPHSLLPTTDSPAIETQEAIALDSLELIESWFNLGLKQASSGDFQGAIASWERVLKLNPHICEAWHNRGSALGRIKKYPEAIESFERALAINPKNYQAWNDRAHALYQLQKWEQAIASWDKAIEILPGDYQFWYNRGCALEKLQRFGESLASYEKALEIKPDFQQARSRYIKLLTGDSQ